MMLTRLTVHDECGEVSEGGVEGEIGGGAGDSCQMEVASCVENQLTECFITFLPALRERKVKGNTQRLSNV